MAEGSAFDSEPAAKKSYLKVDIFDTFHEIYTNIDELSAAFDALMNEQLVHTLTLRNCNANDLVPKSFSKASCDIQCQKRAFMYGSLFMKGMVMLREFLLKKVKPKHEVLKDVLECLLSYLLDTGSQNKLDRLDRKSYSEAVLTAVLTNHLFLKLSPVNTCAMNSETETEDPGSSQRAYLSFEGEVGKTEEGKVIRLSCCPCSSYKKCLLSKEITLADTSIGNTDVWHGRMDCLLGGVALENFQKHLNSPGRQSFFEFKKKFAVKKYAPVEQIVAQCIVFSFLRAKIDPEVSLVPTIGVSAEKMAVYFYDSKNDILLKSSTSEFSEAGSERLQVILMAWLATNYQYLGGHLEQCIKDQAQRSNFVELVKDKIEVYQSHLTYGVGSRESRWKRPKVFDVFVPDEHKKVKIGKQCKPKT